MHAWICFQVLQKTKKKWGGGGEVGIAKARTAECC